MDIIKYAMQMELDGKTFYENGAKKASAPMIRKVFETLAVEEHRHYHFFKNMKENKKQDVEKAVSIKKDAVKMVKNVFMEMVDSGKDQIAGDSTKTIWEEALLIEQKAEKLYRDAAEKEADKNKKKLLNIIADEEKSHIYLIDNMLSFLKDPETFAASQNYQSFMSWEGR